MEQRKKNKRKNDRATYSLGEDYISLLSRIASDQRRTQTDILRESIDRLAKLYGHSALTTRPHIGDK